jgi:excisionase family DNA binding protein
LTDKNIPRITPVMKLISTADAAARLGIHITRVQVLIREGRLPAQMIGGSYVINEGDLKLVAVRKPGRPQKQTKDRDASTKRNQK